MISFLQEAYGSTRMLPTLIFCKPTNCFRPDLAINGMSGFSSVLPEADRPLPTQQQPFRPSLFQQPRRLTK